MGFAPRNWTPRWRRVALIAIVVVALAVPVVSLVEPFGSGAGSHTGRGAGGPAAAAAQVSDAPATQHAPKRRPGTAARASSRLPASLSADDQMRGSLPAAFAPTIKASSPLLGNPGDVGPIAGANGVTRERALQSGVSLTPSKTEPYWACPRGACEAIVDPPATKAAGRWVLPDGARALEGAGEKGGFDPQDLRSAYGIPSSGGEKQEQFEERHTIALVDVGHDPMAEAGLQEYRKRYSLPACTKAAGCFREINQRGEEGNLPPRSEEWELETSLDLDMASAACPHCHILLAEAGEETLAALAEAANSAAKLGATEISNSYGLPELDAEACGAQDCRQLNTDYDHPGVLITASAGDGGYDNYLRGGASPLFPASSPYVIAVGGTSLHRVEVTEGRKWSESVWWEPETRKLGTGSGCSSSELKPAWQTDAGCSHRTDNDVAAVGACETPVSVYSTGIAGWANVCGTSASAPLIAALEAHAGEAGGAVPTADAFYQDRSTLYNVTKGRDTASCSPEYLCSAETQEAGYDGPAGNGTPSGGPVSVAGEPPSVRSEPESSGGKLNGVLDANGLSTTYHFEYGTTTAYGTSIPASEAPAGHATSAVKVSQTLPSLPLGVYHFRLVATNHDGTSDGEDLLFDTAPPTVSSLAPTSGFTVGGAHVKISGTNFIGVTGVKFGSVVATSFKVLSETEIEASSPAGAAGTVDVTVETASGTSATGQADRFTYVTLPPPAVTAVAPAVGRTTGGTWATIYGADFVGVTSVNFGSTAASSYTVLSETEIEAQSPAGTGTVGVSVTTSAGASTASPADQFTFAVPESPSGATPGWLAPSGLTEQIPHAAFPNPAVATDRRGDAAAVWTACKGTNCSEEFVQATYRPAGGSWQTPAYISPSGNRARSQSQVVLDSRGQAIAIWAVFSGQTETVQAAVRPAGGSWEAPVDLSAACEPNPFTSHPQLALDAKGDLLAAWRCYKSGHVSEQTAWRPAGRSWQASVALAEAAEECPGGLCRETLGALRIAMDPAGEAFAGWVGKEGASQVAFRSTDESWQAPVAIAAGGGGPQLAVDGNGNAYALVDHNEGLAVAYRPAAGGWQAPVQVVSRDREGGPYAPQLAVDAQGDEVLVWSGWEAGKENVYAARKLAGGNWQVPVTLAAGSGEGDPQVAFDAAADAVAVWQAAGSSGHVLEAAQLPASGGWHAPVVISGSAAKAAAEPRVAVDPQGDVVVSWERGEASETWSIETAALDAGPQLEALSIPASAAAGQAVSFSVSPLGVWSPLRETKWTFGDNSSGSGTAASHTYAAVGSYKVTVESEDALGITSRASRTIAVAPSYSFSTQLGAYGRGGAHFLGPDGVAVDSHGHLWVADVGNSRVQELEEGGTYIGQIGQTPTGEEACAGALCYPMGVAIDAAGHVWVADTNRNRIEEYEPSGALIRQCGSLGSGNGQFTYPEALAVDSAGNVWVADSGNNRVQELSAECGYERQFGSIGFGNGQFIAPFGIAVDAKGAVWVSDSGSCRVQKFSSVGAYEGKFGSCGAGNGQFGFWAAGIALDKEGHLFVADAGNSRVEEFSEGGEYFAQYGTRGAAAGQLEAPWGIAVDAKGQLWVSDSFNEDVQKWVPSA
jgi:sugar lactone lactonase YvrE